MNFSEKVRTLRREKGLSQTALSQKIGVTTRTIQSYEAGKSYPKRRELYQLLADALDTDVNYLMTENEAFITQAHMVYGEKGAAQAKDLVTEISGLFAGGQMADEDMDEMMRAIQEAYWIAKENNRKFGHGNKNL